MAKVLILLGGGEAVVETMDWVKRRIPDVLPVIVRYGDANLTVRDECIYVTSGNEVEQILEVYEREEIGGVVNRFDSYIPLWGRLVDAFGVEGSSLEAVMKFKNKMTLHELMVREGLGGYRPKTQVVDLDWLKDMEAKKMELPIVVKPYMGAKSRGVFLIHDEIEWGEAVERLERHFRSDKLQRSGAKEELVLLEEYVSGEQVTCMASVDGEGEVRLVGCSKVLTGRDVGQKHQQLVYRTTPAKNLGDLPDKMEELLQRLVSASGLKSTFIFPDFIWSEGRLILIEVNVRIGGYRTEMYKRAYGVDLVGTSVNLALGKEVDLRRYDSKSCTAVEWWSDRSGTIRELPEIEDARISGLKVNFGVGDVYAAPPVGDVPLARFYVMDEVDSLRAAKELVGKLRVGID